MMSTVGNYFDWLFYLYEQDARCRSQCGRPHGGMGGKVKSSFPGWRQMGHSLDCNDPCQEADASCQEAAEQLYGGDAKVEGTPEFYQRFRQLGPDKKSCVTTRLIANVYPQCKTRSPLPTWDRYPEEGQRWNSDEDVLDRISLENWVKTEYLYRWPEGVERFCLDGNLEDIIPQYNAEERGGSGSGCSLKPVEDFLGSLLYIVRNVECTLYCNGYEICQPRDPSLRIECILFRLHPFRIVLRVAEFHELDIVRLSDRIELTASDRDPQRARELDSKGAGAGAGCEENVGVPNYDSDDSSESLASFTDIPFTTAAQRDVDKAKKMKDTKRRFCIYCQDPDYPQNLIMIEVPKDGTVVIDFPVFVKGLEVWDSKLYEDKILNSDQPTNFGTTMQNESTIS